MNKEEEYRWIATLSAANARWLAFFLEREREWSKSKKRLAWLRIMGLIETWDIAT